MITETISDVFKGPLLQVDENTNVSKSERILSIASGSFIFFRGITNLFSNPLIALTELTIGGFLVHRGVTGECKVKPMIDREDQPEALVITTY